MRILDRYIVRQFLANFAILLVVFMGLILTVDLLTNLDEFTDAGKHRQREQGGAAMLWTARVMVDYYGPLAMLLYTFLSGLVVNAAAGFTLATLVRHREVVAALTGGVSMYRLAAPVLVTGFALNLLALPLQEWAIPRVAHKIDRDKQHLAQDASPHKGFQFAADSHGHLLSARLFDPVAQTLTDATVLVRDQRHQATRRISAPLAQWDERLGGWRLPKAQVVDRQAPLAPRPASGPGENQAPVVQAVLFETDLSPQVIEVRRSALRLRLLSLEQLHELLSNPNADRGLVFQIIHSRLSFLVVHLLILSMAMPFFLLREPSGQALKSAQAAGLCLTAWVGAVVLQQFSGWYLNPVAASWLPVATLLPVAAGLLGRIRT